MSIRYKYVRYSDKIEADKEVERVRPVAVTHIGYRTKDLVEHIVKNNYYSSPDAYKAVEAVFKTIEHLLREGGSVTVDGYGTFSPTLQFLKKNIDNDDPEKKDKSASIRAQNIQVKSIVFKSTKDFRDRIAANNIERLAPDAPRRRRPRY